MNLKTLILTLITSTLLLTTHVVWSKSTKGCAKANPFSSACNNPSITKAPEIDAASGVIPLALLSGFIALATERKRAIHPKK
jgi:hypothetical protein